MKTSTIEEAMIVWRRDFHMHPELGFDEHRTSARIAELLRDFGLEVHQGIGGTGVVGVLQRGNGQKSVGLRADMDALPIHEINSFDHASSKEGIMHACGHDGHTTMLLGAAKYLAEHGQFKGRVVFIFQPNEEHGLGAKAMIDDGLFDRFDVDQVFAMHNMPGMEIGTFATRAGPMTAAESLFSIEVKAKGGHAALPHMGVDAITVGAQIVGALQTIVSRKLDPGQNGVVSVTEFVTDGKRNVLPGRAVLKGDARALTAQTNAILEEKMRQIVEGVCTAHGVEALVSYDTIFPPTFNAADASAMATKVATRLLGQDAVDGTCAPKLFSEDFAHMASHRSGCFFLMGNGMNGNHARPLHSADYDFNDQGLVPGSSFWVDLVEQTLSDGH